MARIYTRTGDQGFTGLIGGRRVPKNSVRVQAYGTVDELNASIGLARCACDDPHLDRALARIQEELFLCGAVLADPRGEGNHPEDAVRRLEEEIDAFSLEIPPLQNFVLPGGVELAARLHVSRTVARRAERMVVTLAEMEKFDDFWIRYLNRLSDWLFVAARLMNHRAGKKETVWIPKENKNRRSSAGTLEEEG